MTHLSGSLALVLLLCALASYRAARLVTVDTLMEGWRRKLQAWAYDETGQYRPAIPSRGGNRTADAATFARGKLADLLTCPFCIGVWLAAGVVVGAWSLGWLPGGRWFALWIPAVAGAQSLMSAADGALTK